jgi:SSS family solute:Na+ symporter
MAFPVPLAVIIGYFVLMLIVGFYASKRYPIKTFEDWSLAGRSFRTITNFFTAHATQLSALQYMGFFAYIYIFGIVTFHAIYNMYLLASVPFLATVLGPKVWKLGRKFGHITSSDLIAHYYGSNSLGLLVGIVLFLAIIPYIQVQVMATGYIFDIASDKIVPYWLGALVAYLIVIVYTWAGGMRAVAYTDIIQGAMLFIGVWIGGAWIVSALGGGIFKVFSEVATKSPTHLLVPPKGWTHLFLFSWALPVALGWQSHPHMWLRLHTPRDEKTARRWPLPMFIFNATTGFFVVLTALTLFLVKPGMAKVADRLFIETLHEYWHPLLFGLIAACALAAIMSTLDSQAHALGIVISNDLIRRYGLRISEEALITVNRIVVAVGLLAGLVLALTVPEYLAWLGGFSAAMGAQCMPGIICALLNQKWPTKWGVGAGIVGGVVVMFATSVGPLTNYGGVYGGMWGLIANLIILVAVSLATRRYRPSDEIVKIYREIGY